MKHKYDYVTYITMLFPNKGQSKVKVSYSPPSPHMFTPYFSFYKHNASYSYYVLVKIPNILTNFKKYKRNKIQSIKYLGIQEH